MGSSSDRLIHWLYMTYLFIIILHYKQNTISVIACKITNSLTQKFNQFISAPSGPIQSPSSKIILVQMLDRSHKSGKFVVCPNYRVDPYTGIQISRRKPEKENKTFIGDEFLHSWVRANINTMNKYGGCTGQFIAVYEEKKSGEITSQTSTFTLVNVGTHKSKRHHISAITAFHALPHVEDIQQYDTHFFLSFRPEDAGIYASTFIQGSPRDSTNKLEVAHRVYKSEVELRGSLGRQRWLENYSQLLGRKGVTNFRPYFTDPEKGLCPPTHLDILFIKVPSQVLLLEKIKRSQIPYFGSSIAHPGDWFGFFSYQKPNEMLHFREFYGDTFPNGRRGDVGADLNSMVHPKTKSFGTGIIRNIGPLGTCSSINFGGSSGCAYITEKGEIIGINLGTYYDNPKKTKQYKQVTDIGEEKEVDESKPKDRKLNQESSLNRHKRRELRSLNFRPHLEGMEAAEKKESKNFNFHPGIKYILKQMKVSPHRSQYYSNKKRKRSENNEEMKEFRTPSKIRKSEADESNVLLDLKDEEDEEEKLIRSIIIDYDADLLQFHDESSTQSTTTENGIQNI